MKKIIVVLLLVASVAAGVTFYLQTQEKGQSVESILPKGALVYVHLNDVEGNLQQMASMPFWKALSNINYDLLMQKNIIPSQQRMVLELVKTQLSQVSSNPMVKKLFGKEVALAVYLPDQDLKAMARQMKGFNPVVVEELLSGIFLVTRMDPDVQFAEVLTRSFSQYGANVTQGETEYKGEIIRTITVSNVGMKLSFVRFGDLLVFGVGDKAARLSIDVFRGSPSLADDPQFEEARSSFLDPSAAVGYFDFETALSLIADQVGKFAGSGADEVFAKMAGLEKFAFSFQMAPVMKINSTILMNTEKLDPEHASIYTCPSEVNTTINFVPKDVLGYHWTNCFDLNYYWREVKKEVIEGRNAAPKIDELQQKIGFDIERDILPAFGDEIGGYISDILVGGIFPIPKIALFIEIKDMRKAQRLLDRGLNQAIAMIQEETHGGVPLKYIALPFGENIQPGYCFLGDYLLVATSRQLLKSSIDASGNNSLSLTANPAFKEINFGLTDKNRSVQFIRIGQIVSKARGLIGWSNQWVTAQERKAQAFKAGSEKPLEEAKESIVAMNNELVGMRDEIAFLEDSIWDLEYKGENVTAQQARISNIKDRITDKELELAGAHERKEELENILSETKKDVPDLAIRQAILDEAVYPILESLKSLETYGLRVTVGKGRLETSVFLKVSD